MNLNSIERRNILSLLTMGYNLREKIKRKMEANFNKPLFIKKKFFKSRNEHKL